MLICLGKGYYILCLCDQPHNHWSYHNELEIETLYLQKLQQVLER